MTMQITDKDIQTFRERAKTELQSNGAVGRLAWDSVVNSLCNEVEELRKNAAISNAVDSAWADVCAACAKGMPPACCAYYGDPNGCNAPTLGKHPEGDLAERLQEALDKAERRIAELERAPGNAAALREAAERICSIDQSETQDLRQLAKFCHDQSIYGGGLIERVLADIEIVRQALSAPPEPPSNAAAMREALKASRDYFVALREKVSGCLSEQYLTQRIANIDAALSAPPRNCDVGDAAEQSERLAKFCKANYEKAEKDKHICSECQFNDCIGECPLKWAQLPFTPEKGGAE